MNLPDGLLAGQWALLAWVLHAWLSVHAVRQARWRVLAESARQHAFLATIVVLTGCWHLCAGVRPGLSLHLLGATVFTLCFGWPLAFLGLSVVLLAVTYNGLAGWSAYGANALLMVGVGVGSSHLIHALVRRALPPNLFVFIFGSGFFASALAVIAVGLVSCATLMLAGVYPAEYLLSEYLPYFVLLGFSEAWLSGMLTTLFAVYRPEFLMDFDDARFLGKK